MNMMVIIWVLWMQYIPGPLVRIEQFYEESACNAAKDEMKTVFPYNRAHCLGVVK